MHRRGFDDNDDKCDVYDGDYHVHNGCHLNLPLTLLREKNHFFGSYHIHYRTEWLISEVMHIFKNVKSATGFYLGNWIQSPLS